MPASVAKLLHARLGLCELVRVEGTDWIVKPTSGGVHYRVPPEKRSQFQPVREAPRPAPQPSFERIPSPKSLAGRNARRMIESLRIGLPTLNGSTRHLAVGFHETDKLINWFLKDVDQEGGSAMTLQGAYGQGKTFALTLLEEMAREAGFITACTEIDATENRLNKPHHIYRDLMRSLRLPDVPGQGARILAQKTHALLQHKCPGDGYERKRWLEAQVGCFPLSWLLSDPRLPDKPALVGLLEGDPNYPVHLARNHHACPAIARMWPAFTAGTQGDFASFVLSGVGRLARVLGYKGFVVIMDEMEKWHELNWAEQSRAGNLLGGLIWGATADEGHRGMDDHPGILSHSGRCGGYPFTTERQCHVGLAIAMTPRRDDDSPEKIWSFYGPVRVGNVPALSEDLLFEYCRRVVPFFATAFGVQPPQEEELKFIAGEAVEIWRKHGDLNTRSGVQAAIAAFDHWRDRQCLRFIITDPSGKYYWAGPGMRPFAGELPATAPHWPTMAEAETAALALRKSIGLQTVVAPVYKPK
jgi:hypothetical protein